MKCPKCEAEAEVKLGVNLLGEAVEYIHCLNCRSVYVCRDGLHWKISVEGNAHKKECEKIDC